MKYITFSQDAYVSDVAMSDLELCDSDMAATQKILELKEQQQKDGTMMSSLQTKLKAAQQQIAILEEELRTKQRDTEELQLSKGVESYMHACSIHDHALCDFSTIMHAHACMVTQISCIHYDTATDHENQDSMKDTTQEILQPVHDRQVHSDQEEPAAHSQELQHICEFNYL